METESHENSLLSGVDVGQDSDKSADSSPEMRRVRRLQLPGFGQGRQPFRAILRQEPNGEKSGPYSAWAHRRWAIWHGALYAEHHGDVHVIVTIVDHGLSNLRSLVSALSFLGHESRFAESPGEVEAARVLILPGVGSFPIAIQALRRRGYEDALRSVAEAGKSKILGICLGMQLLLTRSDEGGGAQGLNLVEGVVERFEESANLQIPHIGFNAVRAPIQSELFAGLPSEQDHYFVHSYRAKNLPPEVTTATTVHGDSFISAFEAGNVYGVQFHPEKSQGNGLRLLSNFLAVEVK